MCGFPRFISPNRKRHRVPVHIWPSVAAIQYPCVSSGNRHHVRRRAQAVPAARVELLFRPGKPILLSCYVIILSRQVRSRFYSPTRNGYFRVSFHFFFHIIIIICYTLILIFFSPITRLLFFFLNRFIRKLLDEVEDIVSRSRFLQYT